ncbi:helix-turn-helix transcriptional regulator [Dactylosporangium sp. NBC_01737]|uniref:helix-turn-helix transcriptional regulator n=1 Tax=Dactylosporangium sp. NBC_01737 TaxID=2975959 RepID=UPI002E0EB01E|nr:helix-turn-helix transcriptional regulator [Dactylosporangium sp. NBC_01737]
MVRADRDQGQAARREELAAFLRARRAQLLPADVGLPTHGEPGLRRTPGLRREEVAELAKVSVTWYTWLEQGRTVSASEQVIDALARALRLDSDHHRHLRGLAGLTAPVPLTAVDDVVPRLQRLVDVALPWAASIYDPHFDYVVWNACYARLRHDPAATPADRRNLLWYLFADPSCRAGMSNWEAAARAVLSQFRSAVGQRPDDDRSPAMVALLRDASAEFRTWWDEHPIRYFRPATITVDHPGLGAVELEMFQVRPVEHADLLMVMQVPVGEADREKVRSLTGPAGDGPYHRR